MLIQYVIGAFAAMLAVLVLARASLRRDPEDEDAAFRVYEAKKAGAGKSLRTAIAAKREWQRAVEEQKAAWDAWRKLSARPEEEVASLEDDAERIADEMSEIVPPFRTRGAP